MKIIVNSFDFNDAVSKVARALPVRDISPVLECIKISADDDKLTLYATDKDLAIEKTIDANVIVGGVTLAPGKVLTEYVRSISDVECDISLETNDENRLVVSTAGSECSFATLEADDYPESEEISDEKYFTIQEASLKEIISNVIFSVATDESRPILRGVFFKAYEYVLTAVATDGFRFATSKKALEEKSEWITATVPARSLAELSKLLNDNKTDDDENSNGENLLRVFVEKNYLMVCLKNTKLLTRLLADSYINYESIIPKEKQIVSSLIVSKDSFERSLNTAAIMSRGDKNNLVVLDIEEYNMNISSTSQYGTAKEDISISLSGKDIRCAYNAKYLNDCLKVIKVDTIKMEFNQHGSCIITKNGSDEVLYFILPVKQIG